MKTNKKCVIGLLAATFALSLGFGVATVNTAMAEETAAAFEMVVGASVRTDDPSGIRFTTVVNDEYKATLSTEYDYVWGTKLTFTPVNGGSYTLDVDTLVWTDDTQTKWHTVLLNVPATDYLTEITAESYVKGYAKDDTEKTTVLFSDTVENATTRSIAWAASWALNDGYTQAKLTEYVSAINTEVTLNKESIILYANDTFTLTASTEENYGVVWTSSDEDVATVNAKTGEVTAVSEGTAEITASVGNNKAVCAISVIPETEVEDNVAMTFAADSDLKRVSVYWPTVSEIEFDSTIKHGEDAGSLKVTMKQAPNDNYILLSNPYNKNFHGYDYISFWVYNAGSAEFSMGTTWAADTVCKVGEWTEVKIAAGKFNGSVTDMSSNALKMKDVTALPLRIFKTDNLTVNDYFYISSIVAKNEPVESPEMVVNFDNVDDLNRVSSSNYTLSLNTDSAYIYGDEAGSLKVTNTTAADITDKVINIKDPLNVNMSRYNYVVFRVYNATDSDIKVGTWWKADTTCKAGE